MKNGLNELNAEKVLEEIKTRNVDLTEEEYKEVTKSAFENANVDKKNKKQISESLKHKRIASNFMGTVINMLLPTYQMLIEIVPIIYAIAEKTGVEFEKIESEEEKAYKAVAEYFKVLNSQKQDKSVANKDK